MHYLIHLHLHRQLEVQSVLQSTMLSPAVMVGNSRMDVFFRCKVCSRLVDRRGRQDVVSSPTRVKKMTVE